MLQPSRRRCRIEKGFYGLEGGSFSNQAKPMLGTLRLNRPVRMDNPGRRTGRSSETQMIDRDTSESSLFFCPSLFLLFWSGAPRSVPQQTSTQMAASKLMLLCLLYFIFGFLSSALRTLFMHPACQEPRSFWKRKKE